MKKKHLIMTRIVIYDNYKATHQNPKISDRSNFQMMVDIFNESPDATDVELEFMLGNNQPEDLDNIKCDLLCVNYYLPFMQSLKHNILVCSRMDSCGLNSRNLKQVDASNISLIGKEYVFQDRRNYTRRFTEGRLHSELILNAHDTEFSEVWQYRQCYQDRLNAFLHRIVPFSWNLLQYSFLHPLMQKLIAEPFESKSVDVFFVCHSHNRSPSLSKHRQNGLVECKRICEKHGFRAKIGSLPRKEYFSTLRKSKVCVAPYGWGSRIALDQYGLATGTLIVKADMEHVVTVPNIYTKEYMHFVQPNWDTLEEVLVDLVTNYETKYKQVARDRKNSISKFNKQYYRDHIAEVFHTAMALKKVI